MIKNIKKEYDFAYKAIKNVYPLYNSTSRKMKNVWCKIIIANYLLSLGYTTTSVGEVMDKDHSTIVHYRSVLYDTKNKEFKEFSELFNIEVKLNKKTEDLLTTKYTHTLAEIPTEYLIKEIQRRNARIVEEFLYSVDGLSESVFEVDKESADKKMSSLHPYSVIEFIRTIDRKRL